MNKAFTLIELLAVIAILAIILLIAVPMVLSTIASSKQGAFKDNAQMVIKAVDLKTASDSTFDYRILSADNVDEYLGIDNNNYASLSVTKQYGKIKVTIVGQGSWNGLVAYGTTDNMYAVAASSVTDYFADKSGANAPEISSNMIPVYYDATCNSNAGCWRKADVNNLEGTYEWYDYSTTAKKWANAVTVTASTLLTYKNASVGTTVLEADILTYMVWIPRYKYYIDSTNKLIYPTFESATINKSTGNATSSSTYRTHPAFTFGTQELSGFWVGKFEATNSISAIQIKPNVYSLRTQTLSTFFTAIRNMEASGNTYGYIATEVDTHVMLNSEWGAVAYLSYSTYGKNSELWINNDNTYHTGCAGATVNAAEYAGCVNAYNTTLGVNASTTGNVYGIYDMSGGAWDYVMGNYNNYSGYNSSSNSGFSGYNGGDTTTTVGLSFPSSQYYNFFGNSDYVLACNGGICYGHALSETVGWNNDSAYFVNVYDPWLFRGGNYSHTTGAGLFYYSGTFGTNRSDTSVRIVQTSA